MTTTWADIRKGINRAAESQHEWAGLPLLVDDVPLCMAPGHPHEKLNGRTLNGAYEAKSAADNDDAKGCQQVNQWYSMAKRGEVVIWREADGRLCHAVLWDIPHQRAKTLMDSMMVLQTFDLGAEQRAQKKLKTLIKPHLFDGYMLCGAFLETSKRSGVSYIFRRLAPTIAMRATGGPGPQAPAGGILACLCLHPIGYYGNLPVGAMTPTDDVIAHLMLMRGDEHQFWKKANHHSPWDWRSLL